MGEGYVGGSLQGGVFHGEREFSMKGTPYFPALFENDHKLNE